MVGIALVFLIIGVFIYSPTEKPIKTGGQIYKEADYLAHISIRIEDIQTGKISTNYASGFLWSLNDKYIILTVAHINDPGARIKEIIVRFKGQPGIYFATLDKKDIRRDYAVLKINDPDFFFMGRLADLRLDKNFEVGDTVYSLGSPSGVGYSLGTGIIRCLDYRSSHKWDSTIITSSDTGIAPGSSGGPLLDAYGKVIGMNVGMRVDGVDDKKIYYPEFGFAVYMEDILSWLIKQY